MTEPAKTIWPMLDVELIRRDFPILATKVHGKPLVYLDNAATSQKPKAVIDSISNYYSSYNANIHRGVHALSEEATAAYEAVREKVKTFLGIKNSHEVVFVRGTTEAINLVAQTFVRERLGCDDEIIISAMEHHSNIVPWQMLCQEKRAKLKVVGMNERGELLIDNYKELFNARTKFVSLCHISNALGTLNPIKELVKIAHSNGVPILIDGAQAAPHIPINIKEIDADFYAFSSHKMFGPTGAGVLYAREKFLQDMPPYQGGGEMISTVTFEKTTYNMVPHKFEAGTPDIAGVIGMGAAIDYLQSLGFEEIERYEDYLLKYATDALLAVPGVRIIGTAGEKVGVISFALEGVHSHDIGSLLDQEGVAIRTGFHCAQPALEYFGVPGSARASFAFYNKTSEVDTLVKALWNVKRVFHV